MAWLWGLGVFTIAFIVVLVLSDIYFHRRTRRKILELGGPEALVQFDAMFAAGKAERWPHKLWMRK